MKAINYIITKQLAWASSRGITLIGSKVDKGKKLRTRTLEENLFKPLTKRVKNEFLQGDGSEIREKDGSVPKMHALHSSSAIGVNIFQYWLTTNRVPEIAAACGFCNKGNRLSQDIIFEHKFSISKKFQYSPNIDVVIKNSDESRIKVFAIECKFSEAYSYRKHDGLKKKYLKLSDIWRDIPHIFSLAKAISPKDLLFQHLHPAQLIKHILGLKTKYGKSSFRLMYLWYDCIGPEGYKHRQEIERFSKIVKKDNILFHSTSYQELISRLYTDYKDKDPEYIHYLTSRYL